ncbi:MAG: imidazolonepropionase [Candidatus Brocadia sp. WS118]|nr:MAG: imidazolonepropionase [Candidatus Brocadia sp. WS118]
MNRLPQIFIQNIGQLVTVAGASQRPKTSREMDDIGIIRNGAVFIQDGIFRDVGTTKRLREKYHNKNLKIIDAAGKLALPGFVDSHTHTVFGGDRAEEFVQRIQGETYLEILKKGGGILKTVHDTRKIKFQKLVEVSRQHLDTMLFHGTTTAEIKTGYGLDINSELKILNVIHHLQKTHPMDLVATFLGAHVVPPEYQYDPDAYVELLCNMLPRVKTYATFCDTFCDEGAFGIKQSEKILKKAESLGFKLKIHTNEFKDIGGVSLAIRLRVLSADHLDNIKQRDIVKLKESDVLCVLLPGVPFFLMRDTYAPALRMIEHGLPVVLATDFNPGTCPCGSMQMIITLACLKMGMTPAQAICAATINGAHALGMANQVGSIETGKQADMIILDLVDYNQLPYYFGRNHVVMTIKHGKIVMENNQFMAVS